MYVAHIKHGYSQQEIAKHSGMHNSTISKIIKNPETNQYRKHQNFKIRPHKCIGVGISEEGMEEYRQTDIEMFNSVHINSNITAQLADISTQ